MFDKLLNDFHGGLNDIDSTQHEILEWAEATYELCHETLTQMKHLIDREGFKDLSEEVHFFKHVKSEPMSHLIYARTVVVFERQKPVIGEEFLKEFIEKEVREVHQFFQENHDFIFFAEIGDHKIDRHFFTRNPKIKLPFWKIVDYYPAPEFSTSYDVLWAKVLAMRRFGNHITEVPQATSRATHNLQNDQTSSLSWSGSKTALVELTYALVAGGDINHGSVDISTLKAAFEKTFNVKLPNIYKTYSEIKARKGIRTKYLQELRYKLEHKMDQDDKKLSF